MSGQFTAPINDLPTPALIVDLDAMTRNLHKMADLAARGGARLRPHAKAHKCVEIARRQIELGAAGVCCQTVGEAEVFAAAGIGDLLITNQIADRGKVERLNAIDPSVRLGLCVDHPMQIELVASVLDRPIDLYVEVEVGGFRCGVVSGAEAVALARAVCERGLTFRGIQAYNGKAQHIYSAAARQVEIARTARRTAQFIDALRKAELAPEIVTGGGTGTAAGDLQHGALNEVQPGTYALMDADYLRVGADRVEDEREFEPACFLLGTIISARPEHAVIDAGLKALGFDTGMPDVFDPGGVTYGNPSDEHGLLRGEALHMLSLGAKVMLIPAHCDPTIAKHRALYVVTGEGRYERWNVASRGYW